MPVLKTYKYVQDNESDHKEWTENYFNGRLCVVTLIVNDTIDNIQNLIDDIINEMSEKEVIKCYFESLSVFLKYGYNHHAMIDHNDSTTHGLRFILGNPLRTSSTTSPSPNNKLTITCTQLQASLLFD